MLEKPKKALTKKNYFQLKQIEALYKRIYKYKLRQEAYKKILELSIKLKKSKKTVK